MNNFYINEASLNGWARRRFSAVICGASNGKSGLINIGAPLPCAVTMVRLMRALT